ncbi:MAG: hypothetical protein JW825_05200 [Candidatus Methanofastidiosa archaeon]|nr:hypothetical protein [Candidatus Methanofastidiosa archaeon]
MILIVASKQDPAGMNIAKNMLEHHDFEKREADAYDYCGGKALLQLIEERTIFSNYIENGYEDVDALFFITRHYSESGIHSLTTHSPGCFTDAPFGGMPGELCLSNPIAQKLALKSMFHQREEAGLDYEVSLEATHHGPITGVPTTFFEVGSGLEQWKDDKAGEIVANATIQALKYKDFDFPLAIGLGGGHYPQKLSEVVNHTEWAIGHIAPKYAFPLEERMIRTLFAKNNGGETAIFDWKGTPDRSRYQEMITSLGYRALKTRDLGNSMKY